MSDTDKVFAGSIPALYETHLVPLIFQPYADDLATRIKSKAPSRHLELAAGTGVLTRALACKRPTMFDDSTTCPAGQTCNPNHICVLQSD